MSHISIPFTVLIALPLGRRSYPGMTCGHFMHFIVKHDRENHVWTSHALLKCNWGVTASLLGLWPVCVIECIALVFVIVFHDHVHEQSSLESALEAALHVLNIETLTRLGRGKGRKTELRCQRP